MAATSDDAEFEDGKYSKLLCIVVHFPLLPFIYDAILLARESRFLFYGRRTTRRKDNTPEYNTPHRKLAKNCLI